MLKTFVILNALFPFPNKKASHFTITQSNNSFHFLKIMIYDFILLITVVIQVYCSAHVLIAVRKMGHAVRAAVHHKNKNKNT